MSDVVWATPSPEILARYEGQMCALVSQAQAEDMIGIATTLYTRLLFEMPSPWPGSFRDMKPHGPAIQDMLKGAYERGEKIYGSAVMSDPAYSVKGMRRVLVWRRPTGPFARFERTEYLIPEDDLISLAQALIEQPDDMPRFDQYQVFDTPARDIFVCTHGAVEASCAKFGYPVFKTLRQIIDAEAPGSARVWRVSHIGNCRYAATLFEMPEGRYWGHLQPEHLRLLALRDGSPDPLYRHYRGWSGLSFFEQIVEREALMVTGWDWTGYQVTGTIQWSDGEVQPGFTPARMDHPPAAVGVRLEYTTPEGTTGAYEATVEYDHKVETFNNSQSRHWFTVNQYRVTALSHMSPDGLPVAEVVYG